MKVFNNTAQTSLLSLKLWFTILTTISKRSITIWKKKWYSNNTELYTLQIKPVVKQWSSCIIFNSASINKTTLQTNDLWKLLDMHNNTLETIFGWIINLCNYDHMRKVALCDALHMYRISLIGHYYQIKAQS